MAASLWSTAFGRSLYSAARICRCSQTALGSYATRGALLSSTRYASSAAQLNEAFVPLVPPSLATETADTEKRLAHDDQPKFETLTGSVSAPTLKGLTQDPFKLVHMSSVQTAVLPLLPQLVQRRESDEEEPRGPRDLMVKARTGTGKTLAFLVPAVEHRVNMLRAHAEQAANDGVSQPKIHRAVDSFARRNVGALIISPTRELATQIANEAIKLTKHHNGFEVRLLVGGIQKGRQVREWNRGRRDIVVATTGRLRDLIENEPGFADDLKTTEIFILDEADTLLDMGFQEDIEAIQTIIKPPEERQTFLFSATMPAKVRQVARSVLPKEHSFINCVPDDAPPTHFQIPQYSTTVPNPEEQLPYILHLLAEDQLSNPGKSKVLVFLPTTRLVKLYTTLAEKIGKHVLPAGMRTRIYEMHSQKNMQSRINTSDAFRKDDYGTAVMFSSDVSARGVDYPGVTRVIQIGLPSSGDVYVHRVGRTGRGSSMHGRADLVLHPWEVDFIKAQLSDVPIQTLSLTQHCEEITALAQKYDANPTDFFTDVPRKLANRVPRAPFQSDVVARLGQIQERFKQLQEDLDEDDIQQAMSSLLAFYASHANVLRIKRPETIEGVQKLTQAIYGRPTHLRIPREFGTRERLKKHQSDFKRSFRHDSNSFGGRDGDSRLGRGWNRDSEDRHDRMNPDSRRGRERDSERFDWESNNSSRFKSSAPRQSNHWEGRGSTRGRREHEH